MSENINSIALKSENKGGPNAENLPINYVELDVTTLEPDTDFSISKTEKCHREPKLAIRWLSVPSGRIRIKSVSIKLPKQIASSRRLKTAKYYSLYTNLIID